MLGRGRDRFQLVGTTIWQVKDKDGNVKPVFQQNRLWELIHKLTGLDVVLEGITGHYTDKAVVHNTITDAALQIAMKRISGLTQDPVAYMALGTGSPGANALGAEVTTNGGERSLITPTNETFAVTGDTAEWEGVFNITGSLTITEEGLFDDASAGNMFASQTMTALPLGNGDTFTYIHQITVS